MKYLRLEKGRKINRNTNIFDTGEVILLEIAIIYFSVKVLQSLGNWYDSNNILMMVVMLLFVVSFWIIGILLLIDTLKDNDYEYM